MTSVYIANVTGDGTTPATAYRPLGFDGAPFAVLMIDNVKARAVVASSSDTITGAGITRLIQAASWSALVTLAKTTNPTTAQRNAVNSWLTGAGYIGLTAAEVTWWDCILYASRQVNPAANLELVSC